MSPGDANTEDFKELTVMLPVLILSFIYPDDESWFAEDIQPEEATTEWRLQVHVTCVSD